MQSDQLYLPLYVSSLVGSDTDRNSKLLHQGRYCEEIAYTLTAQIVAITAPMNKIHLWSLVSAYRAFCEFLCGFPDGHLIIVYLFFHAPDPPGNLNSLEYPFPEYIPDKYDYFLNMSGYT